MVSVDDIFMSVIATFLGSELIYFLTGRVEGIDELKRNPQISENAKYLSTTGRFMAHIYLRLGTQTSDSFN